MSYSLLTFRSQTEAMKASRILRFEGIWNTVVKPPRRAMSNGCTHGVKIKENNLSETLSLLKEEGIYASMLYSVMSDGGILERGRV